MNPSTSEFCAFCFSLKAPNAVWWCEMQQPSDQFSVAYMLFLIFLIFTYLAAQGLVQHLGSSILVMAGGI